MPCADTDEGLGDQHDVPLLVVALLNKYSSGLAYAGIGNKYACGLGTPCLGVYVVGGGGGVPAG